MMRWSDVCHLSLQCGHIQFTDNWYSSMNIAKQLWEQFGMLFIGTMSLKTKGMWTKNDYPFDALSTGAQKLVN